LQKYFHDVIACRTFANRGWHLCLCDTHLADDYRSVFQNRSHGRDPKKSIVKVSQILAANVNLMEKMKSDYYDHKKTNLGSAVDRPK